MSGEIISPDRIAELVSAAKDGSLPETQAPAPQRRHGGLRTVDFSRPSKFTADQQRRIVRATETYCQTAVTRLSSELRAQVELELLNVVQLTWLDAQSQLPPNCLQTVLEVQPIQTKMLLATEQSFVLFVLECMLGGSPDQIPRQRRLTEIEWELTRSVFTSLLLPLSPVWEALAGVTFRVGEFDPPEGSQIALVSEPTLVVMLECRINNHSFSLTQLIPWIAIEPIAGAIGGQEDSAQERRPTVSRMYGAMRRAPVTLRAEVASIQMSITDILALAPGATIDLGADVDEGIRLSADTVTLLRAHPGARRGRRAAQVCSGPEPAA